MFLACLLTPLLSHGMHTGDGNKASLNEELLAVFKKRNLQHEEPDESSIPSNEDQVTINESFLPDTVRTNFYSAMVKIYNEVFDAQLTLERPEKFTTKIVQAFTPKALALPLSLPPKQGDTEQTGQTQSSE